MWKILEFQQKIKDGVDGLLARCTHCNFKWKVKDIWSLGFTKEGKDCPSCKNKQYVSFKDRGFILGLGYLSGTIAILIIIFFPFFIKLSNQDETIF